MLLYFSDLDTVSCNVRTISQLAYINGSLMLLQIHIKKIPCDHGNIPQPAGNAVCKKFYIVYHSVLIYIHFLEQAIVYTFHIMLRGLCVTTSMFSTKSDDVQIL